MPIHKKNLLVTLSDASHIEQAKQLFSSVYWNAGWKGDYLLLANEVPESELAWFRAKDIFVYECQTLVRDYVGRQKHPPVVVSKLYLFTQFFKQWDTIVFLDSDIIVRSSLEALTDIRGFAAPDATGIDLGGEFYPSDRKLFQELKSAFALSGPAFNTGVFVFSTDIIEGDTFDRLMRLFDRFGTLNACGEEGTLNLFLKERRQELPIAYNMYPMYAETVLGVKQDKFEAIIVHFATTVKPWSEKSSFYREWADTLSKADRIDLSRRVESREIWSPERIKNHARAIRRSGKYPRGIIYKTRLALDRWVGLAGIVIRKVSPGVYHFLQPHAPCLRPRP